MPDRVFGRDPEGYTLADLLGESETGPVYRAVQHSTDRDVAIKFIRLPAGAESGQRFRQVMRRVSTLDHPYILPIYDYRDKNGWGCIIMRYMPHTLEDLLAQGPLPPEHVAALLGQIAGAVDYAHSRDILHLRLKPTSIFIDTVGQAIVSGFGQAEFMSPPDDEALDSSLKYRPPETFYGRQGSPQADIYSIGVLLYDMLCPRTPYDIAGSYDLLAALYQHLDGPSQTPSQLNPRLPPALDPIVLRALERSPEARYSSATELADSFRQALQPLSQAWPAGSLLRAGLLLTVFILALLVSGSLMIRPAAGTYTLRRDASAPLEALEPDETRIELAQQRMGEAGFIALLPCTMASEYHAALFREIQTFSENYGIAARIYNSEGDAYLQRLLLEQTIIEGAGAFILCALDYVLLGEPLLAIAERHLPLVHIQEPDPEYRYDGVVVFSRGDDYDMGLAAGRHAGQVLLEESGGMADVIVLDEPKLQFMAQRADGLVDGLLETAPQASIIGFYPGDERREAYETIMELIRTGLEFDVILCVTDAGAVGAVDALEERGFAPDEVMIFSIDGEQLPMQYIRDGYFLRSSLLVPRQQVAHGVVDVTVHMLAGAAVPGMLVAAFGPILTRDNVEHMLGP